MGHLNLAQLKVNPESPALSHLESIEHIIIRASDLTKQMLAYSGKGRFVVKPHDLNTVVKEMTHLLEVSISKKIAIRHHLSSTLPAIEADGAQLQQVIMNLVTNASDAIGDQEGIIGIATRAQDLDDEYIRTLFPGQKLDPGRYVILEVSDSGCGMNPEIMDRIFDPFFTTKAAGRGLGLCALLGILRGHHAGIKIYSEVGKGTTFKLFFPSLESITELETPSMESLVHGFEGTVLLVDDEPVIQDSTGAALENLGFKVLRAMDGVQAVSTFQEHSDEIALVILDLTMPRMDGREAFALIHKLKPDVKVILSSGYSEQDSVPEFMGKGLAGFIQKPYQLKELTRLIRICLDK
jgi:two-component system, cell cycle sensor histidine kinase and response regulator CckA